MSGQEIGMERFKFEFDMYVPVPGETFVIV